MFEETHPDQTLPSLVAALPGHYTSRPLVCTIIFHPLTRRIGERFEVPARLGGEPLVVGRNGPGFRRAGDVMEASIDERHVSRRALLFSWQGDSLHIERPRVASRAQVAGKELQDVIRLDPQQLSRGVPLMLSHTVVLLLRFDSPSVPGHGGTEDFGLLGGSNYLAGLREEIRRAARCEEDVLIRGETGSGKELVATAIHAGSERAGRPLVAVNMAAISAELASAALFGSARGAYTGAERAHEGYFLQAQGGTLFLDEVGDTPPGVQPQLLRALQQREIQPIGGALRRVSLRVISATDASLDSDACDFKSALRHRLGSLEIRLSPLREHPEDIGELALHFLTAAARSMGKDAILPGERSSQLEIARWAELFHQLLRYRWPGNVRELANTCRQVVAGSDSALAVPDSVRHQFEKARRDGRSIPSASGARRMHEIDEEQFARAWAQSGFEPAGTARLLGVSRQSVYRRIDGLAGYRLAGQVDKAELRQVLASCEADSARAARHLRVSLSALRAVLRGTDLEWR